MFSSRSVMVLGITFRSLNNFEFIFEYGVKKCFNLILLHKAVHFSTAPLVEETVFFYIVYSPLYIFVSLVVDWT